MLGRETLFSLFDAISSMSVFGFPFPQRPGAIDVDCNCGERGPGRCLPLGVREGAVWWSSFPLGREMQTEESLVLTHRGTGLPALGGYGLALVLVLLRPTATHVPRLGLCVPGTQAALGSDRPPAWPGNG